MRNFHRYIFCSVLGAVSSIGLAPLAAAQIALEPEFVVNQTTVGIQTTTLFSDFLGRSVDELSNGNRIVSYADGAGNTHRVAIISSSGAPVTDIDLGAASSGSASVAALTTGGFVAAYSDGLECLIEYFNNAGASQIGPINVATSPAETQTDCSVAPLQGGDFIVAWANNSDIYVRRFNDAGTTQTGEVIVDGDPGGQSFPVAAPRSGGGFVITWRDFSGGDGDNLGVFMRAYDAGNNPVTMSRVVVNSTTAGFQGGGIGKELSDGNLVFSFYTTTDRRFRVLQPNGAQVVAETIIPNSRSLGDIIAFSSGGFAAFHRSSGTDVRMAEYQNNGTLISDTQISSNATNASQPRATIFSDDDFLVVYNDNSAGADGDGRGVLGRSRQAASAASVVSLDAASNFSGQVLASEATGTLTGDVVLDFGLASKFEQMGAGGVVELAVSLNNAVFASPISVAPNASDNDCDFNILSGGGVGGSSFTYQSSGTVNQCSGFSANDASITLPISVVNNGDPVSVDVTFTPTADVGGYTGDSVSLDLLSFEQLLSFTVDFDGAADPAVGLFDADGDALEGSGEIARITRVLNGNVAETAIGGGAASADSADDIIASAHLIVTFPEGATGIAGVTVSGAGACTPGAGASANVFTCPASGAQVDEFDGATDGLVTLTADADPLTTVTVQTPRVALNLTGDAGFAPVDLAETLAAAIELNDGLAETAITAAANAFDWVRIGSDGTQSNFRIALANGAETGAITQVRVTCGSDNGGGFGLMTLEPSPGNADPSVGFRTSGGVLSFTSAGLGDAANGSGNCDITSVELQYPEGVLAAGDIAGASADRLLITRNQIGLSDL